MVRLQTYLKEQHKVKAIKNVSTDVSIEAIKNESGDDSVESSKKKARVEAPKKSTTVAPVEIKKKKKSAAPIEKSTYKNIVEDTLDEMVIKKRRTINYKSVVEESKEVKIKKTILDCPHCDKSFDVMKSLNHHLNVAHNNLNTVQCTKCNNWFKIKVVDVDDFISIFKEEIENGVCDSCSYRK